MLGAKPSYTDSFHASGASIITKIDTWHAMQRVGDVRYAHIGNVLPIDHAAWHNIGDATTSVIADNLNCLQIMHAHAVFGLLCPRWTTNNTRNVQNNDKLMFKLNHFLSIFG